MITAGLRFSKWRDTYCILRAKKASIPLCCVSLGPLHFFTSCVTRVGSFSDALFLLIYLMVNPGLFQLNVKNVLGNLFWQTSYVLQNIFFLEKTPMCLINELARHNKTTHQYRLTDETGIFSFWQIFTSLFSFKFNKTSNFVSVKPLEK